MRLPNLRRLQWKLTLTYTLVTTAAILVVELGLLVFLGFLFSRSETFPKVLIPLFEDAVSDLAPALEQQPVDTDTLDRWLADLVQSGRLDISGQQGDSGMRLNVDPAAMTLGLIVDRQGKAVSVYPEDACTRGEPAQQCVSPVDKTVLAAALRGEDHPDRLVVRAGSEISIAVPIRGRDGVQMGALLVRIRVPARLGEYPLFALRSLLPSSLTIALFTGIIGTLFGFLTARGLTKRLNALAMAADAWSKGDFSVVIREQSQDELGQLARRLNRMAEQLQNLLQTREQLAALEERNRLARDLHDSVKQQVFAIIMQVAAARNTLAHDPQTAHERLLEAEQLARQAQEELTALIRELRPAALEGKGLAPALQRYVEDWARQTGIEAQVHIHGARPLPLHVEQALFRVAQEALANVARHSHADSVRVMLQWNRDTVTLRIEDNGRGFEPKAVKGRGFGLVSMQERVQALGGTFHIESKQGQGAVVEVTLKPEGTGSF